MNPPQLTILNEPPADQAIDPICGMSVDPKTALWADKDATLLDRVSATLSLGDPAAAKLLDSGENHRACFV